jgi:hypothetical protein
MRYLLLAALAAAASPSSAASLAMSAEQALAAVEATADPAGCARHRQQLADMPIEFAYASMAIPYGNEPVRATDLTRRASVERYLREKAAYWARVDAALEREQEPADLKTESLDVEPVSVRAFRMLRIASARRSVRLIVADIARDSASLRGLPTEHDRQSRLNEKSAVFHSLCER